MVSIMAVFMCVTRVPQKLVKVLLGIATKTWLDKHMKDETLWAATARNKKQLALTIFAKKLAEANKNQTRN